MLSTRGSMYLYSTEREDTTMNKLGYRVIYNQDAVDLFMEVSAWKQAIAPEHVDRMVDEVADGGADVFLVNPNMQMTVYPSRAWETYWESGRPVKWGSNPNLMKDLAVQCDYLQRSLARCRERGMVPGASIRMNDMHGFPEWPGSTMFSRFYMEHPEWQLDGSYSARGYAARGLDYGIPEVREYFMALIREVTGEYDVDVLELDFTRFPAYFERENIEQHCATMNTFIAEVRKTLDSTGRRITLMPRTPATPGGALGMGLDPRAWAKEGTIDAITISDFLNTGWEMPIGKFRNLVGQEIAIFAAAECHAFTWDGLDKHYLPTDGDLARGFAAGCLASGADGVCLFNYFCTRPGQQNVGEPLFDVLAELDDLESLRSKGRHHAIVSGFKMPEINMPNQVPVEVAASQSRAFHMALAAEADGIKASIKIVFGGSAKPENLWLYLNEKPVGSAGRIVAGTGGDFESHEAVYHLPSGLVRDGINEIVLRCENTTVRVLGLEACFRA